MKENILKKGSALKMLNELLRDCKQSDREISKKVNVSQPTMTRARTQLEKLGIIKSYMAIPDFAKIGFTFGAVATCELRKPLPDTSLINIISTHSVVASASSISEDSDFMLITMHRTMEDYDALLRDLKEVAAPGTLKVTQFATHGLGIKAIQVPRKGT